MTAQRDPLVGIYRRLRILEEAGEERNDRLADVERAMTELVRRLEPVLTDYEYDKRRRADRRKSLSDWRVLVAAVGGLVVLAESVLQMVHGFH